MASTTTTSTTATGNKQKQRQKQQQQLSRAEHKNMGQTHGDVWNNKTCSSYESITINIARNFTCDLARHRLTIALLRLLVMYLNFPCTVGLEHQDGARLPWGWGGGVGRVLLARCCLLRTVINDTYNKSIC